jgi:hypothetical protein
MGRLEPGARPGGRGCVGLDTRNVHGSPARPRSYGVACGARARVAQEVDARARRVREGGGTRPPSPAARVYGDAPPRHGHTPRGTSQREGLAHTRQNGYVVVQVKPTREAYGAGPD